MENKEIRYEYKEYTAVIGAEVIIPCNVTPALSDDQVTLVLWYRGDSGNPIYSVDTRQGHTGDAMHFASKQLGSRATFNMSHKEATLAIKPVREVDGGEYRCRVDFRRSRTMNTAMKLIIVVPPKSLTIKDSKNRTLSGVIGPLEEGSKVSLICESIGGRPAPVLSWWKGSTLLDDSDTPVGRGIVRNELVLLNLQREDLLTSLTCQATNTNLTIPVSSSVTIDLSLGPRGVQITTAPRPLSEGQQVDVSCRAFGARPPARISWWVAQENLDHLSRETIAQDGNMTDSILRFRPTSEENGKHLVCRAQNPDLSNSALEDQWPLNVLFPPQLSLALGASQQYEHIREGTDVYFDCNIQANPPVSVVKWKFQSAPLEHSPSYGVIVRNHSLLLKNVGRRHRGRYQCLAVNSQGEGHSEEALLRVQFSPVCTSGQKTVYGVGKHEEVNVTCEVDADPGEVWFKWLFNNSAETLDVITFSSLATKSIATYIPRSRMDYGTLTCWGKNSIGTQRQPCTFSIVPTGPPDPLTNCSVINATSDTIVTSCMPGMDDGGLKTTFHLEAIGLNDNRLHVNVTTFDAPLFVVPDLPSGMSFEFVMYSANAKGPSKVESLIVTTLFAAQRRTAGEEQPIAISVVLAVLMGLVGALVLLAIVIIFIMKSRSSRSHGDDQEDQDHNEKMPTPKLKHFEDDSPDVIPSKPFCTDYSSITSNTSDKIYENVGDKDHTYENIMNRVHYIPTEPYDDITYAELALPAAQQPFVRHRLEPPTEYADIDFQGGRATTTYALSNVTQPLGDEEENASTPLVRPPNMGVRVLPDECPPALNPV